MLLYASYLIEKIQGDAKINQIGFKNPHKSQRQIYAILYEKLAVNRKRPDRYLFVYHSGSAGAWRASARLRASLRPFAFNLMLQHELQALTR
jgi:hypothetical protein